MRYGVKLASIGLIGAFLLVGCGEPPAEQGSDESTGTAGKKLKACMVLDVGGVDDRSFNQSSWAGLQEAKKENSNIEISYVSSTSQNDYVPNLNAEVNKGCAVTVAVGGLMADATKKVAAQHADKSFAEVDAPSSGDNVYGMQYNTAQPAFQAGYLAAGMSKSGKVATFGGLAIPPVTIYMDGFWEGVQYYNKEKGKDVQVLGWNEKNQKGGTFAQSFTDQGKGRSISQSFIRDGADIVFPVAGSTGLGAGAAAKASGGKANLIWVDTDGCVSAKQYCQYFITSVTKGMTKSVKEYAVKAAEGNPPTGNYIGDFSNDGASLAPFHEFESKVPAELKSELEQIKEDISSGKIKVTSPAQPKE
ncbi:MAG: BMP family ABC transporter substrate-binding protein [Streptosporangiales bacterium]|nr:BMP family ABC transporter substrate-binding protein [Streptosporangiales bacterium]